MIKIQTLDRIDNIEHIGIKNYPDYTITNNGRVYSLKSKKFLKPFITNQGYEVVSLCHNGKVKKYAIHQLVAKHFILKSNENQIWINHIDGVKTNNNSNNLQWVTPSENNLHSYKNGLNVSKKGEDHFAAKLNNNEVAEIKRLLDQGMNYKPIAKLYNVSTTLIGAIKRKSRRVHG